MQKERHSKRYHGSQNNQKNNNRKDRTPQRFIPKKPVFHPTITAISPEQIRETEENIRVFKQKNKPECSFCKKEITDMSTAISKKDSTDLAHFDCVLESLASEERLETGEKIAYIGQGRFGVLVFPNPHDMRNFTIRKVIEWEDKEQKPEWRDEMAELYSKIW